MGFEIALQNERGQVIERVCDPENFLHRVFERAIPEEPHLAEIDWNSDTRFNQHQMPRFLSEWEVMIKHCKSADETALVEEVKSLAERCKAGVHLYLEFIGD